MQQMILTNSSISQFKNCRKAWHLRNIENLVPRIQTTARGIGTAIHKGIETGSTREALMAFDDAFPNSQEEANALETNKAIVEAMLEGYFEYFGTKKLTSQNELKFEIDIINPATKAKSKTFKLAGKVDALTIQNGRYWLNEYKTASQVGRSYIDKLQLDAQITTYIYGIQRLMNIAIDGVIYRVLRKPSIKQTKKETLFQYINRLTEDYKARPDFYFFEEKLYRSQDDLMEFEAEIWDLTQDMLKCLRENRWYKNTSRCLDWGNCEYMPLCCHRPDALDLYENKKSNSELEEGTDYASVASF